MPTPDSTEELQVLTAPFSAQYGQSGGGAVLTTTRSGKEKFHGGAFESYSSQSLNALGYFTAPGTVINPSSFHYFGGSSAVLSLFQSSSTAASIASTFSPTGGHAHPRKFPIQRRRSYGGGTDWRLLWTFSPGRADSNNLRSYDDGSRRRQDRSHTFPRKHYSEAAARCGRSEHRRVLPQPNCSLNNNNYCSDPESVSSYLYNASRVNYNLSDYDHLWAKFSRDGPTNQPVNDIPNAANTSALNGWVNDHYEISWSHIFSPRISNEARFGYVSEENFSSPLPTNASSIGLQGVPLTQFPSVSTAEYASFGAGSFARTRDGHYILNDAVVLQMGRHSLSVGGEFMRYAYSYYTPGVLSGKYSFTGMFTSVPGQTGNGLADLLLGLPATTNISTTNTIFHENLNYFADYIQDDYRLTAKLTINLGLRWEFDGPFSEEHNNMYTFDPNVIDPTTSKQGGIQFAG